MGRETERYVCELNGLLRENKSCSVKRGGKEEEDKITCLFHERHIYCPISIWGFIKKILKSTTLIIRNMES